MTIEEIYEMLSKIIGGIIINTVIFFAVLIFLGIATVVVSKTFTIGVHLATQATH